MTIIIIIITTTCCCRRLSPAIQYLGKSRISLQKLLWEKDTQQIVIADSDGIANLVSKTMTRTDLLSWWSTLSPSFLPPLFFIIISMNLSLTLEEKRRKRETEGEREKKKKTTKSVTRKSWDSCVGTKWNSTSNLYTSLPLPFQQQQQQTKKERQQQTSSWSCVKFTAVFYSLSLSLFLLLLWPTTCRPRAYNISTYLSNLCNPICVPSKTPLSHPREPSLLPKSIHLKCSNSSAKSTSIATLRSAAGVCRRRVRSCVQSRTGHFVGDGRSVNVGDNSGVGGSVQGGAEGAFGSGWAGAGDDDVETCEIEKRLG